MEANYRKHRNYISENTKNIAIDKRILTKEKNDKGMKHVIIHISRAIIISGTWACNLDGGH